MSRRLSELAALGRALIEAERFVLVDHEHEPGDRSHAWEESFGCGRDGTSGGRIAWDTFYTFYGPDRIVVRDAEGRGELYERRSSACAPKDSRS